MEAWWSSTVGVELRDGAELTGDVISRSAPIVDRGATIGGDTQRIQTNLDWNGFGWAGGLAWWLAVSVLHSGGRAAAVAGRSGRPEHRGSRPDRDRSVDRLGVAGILRLPILGILALVSIVGIPFGLAVLAALG
jgi:hypothetical protein